MGGGGGGVGGFQPGGFPAGGFGAAHPLGGPGVGGFANGNHVAAWGGPESGAVSPPTQAPLAAVTGESSLTEGRYGLQFFGVEGLDPVLTCAPEDISLLVREYVASVEYQQQPPAALQRGSRDGRSGGGGAMVPSLFLDARGERTFGPGSVTVSRSGRSQGQYKFKNVEVPFSVLQNRELHVFVVELYAPDGRLLGWTEITVDALGEKARPLRGGVVEAALALKNPGLRAIAGALVGVDTFRSSWKQQLQGGKASKRPVSPASENSDDDHPRGATPPPRRPSAQRGGPSASNFGNGGGGSSGSGAGFSGGMSNGVSQAAVGAALRAADRSDPPRGQPDNNRDRQPTQQAANNRDAAATRAIRDAPLPTANNGELSIRSTSGGNSRGNSRTDNYDRTPPAGGAVNNNRVVSPAPYANATSNSPPNANGTFAVRGVTAGILNATQPPEENPFEPDDGAALKVGKGPSRDAARLGIDSVVGVPLHVCCTRVVVYYASAKVDGEEQYPHDAEDFFLRPADVVAYQTLDSSTAEPAFVSEVNLTVGRKTTAIAIVECVDPKKNVRFTLGHAVLPVNQDSNAGNYKTRLLWGDPRPSHLRNVGPKTIEEDQQHRAALEKYDTTQLNASLLSRELKDALKERVPRADNRNRFWPCAYILWRADSNDRRTRYKEPGGQFPLTEDEALMARDRERIPARTPASMDVKSMDTCYKLFEQKSVPADDAIAYACPYNPNRGLFIAPECLRGMTTERCLYKVMIEMSVEGGEQTSNFTQHHNFDSDIGVPEFLDEPFIFAKVPYSLTGVAVFRIFKMLDPSVDRPGGVMPCAWSATKLFLEDGVVRHGRFSVPLFAGVPPPRLLDELKKERIDQTIMKWTSNPPTGHQKLEYLKPNCIVTFCQGDAVRSVELVDQKEPFIMDARLLLVPSKVRRQFPFQDDEGYLEQPLSDILPSGVSKQVFQEEMNKQLKKCFKRM
ncbi:Hypothetical protein, putative [Bodo saltans]|uniref:Uncharacterized protein n=1 Tax=Bodo saltans TaxID=75058 RepID=A0A0S4KP94_BODSA|nr:Hypothetical protein, putative [Bodo saltans]|eukprot:CUI15443.1 Hypothetical protein, putative [Bodo saltans]